MSRAGDLLVLQQNDDQIAGLRRDVARLAAALEGDAQLTTLRGAEKAARADAAAAAARATTAEAEAAALTTKAKKLEKRLYDGSTGNPGDLLTMQRELDALRERVAAADDALLLAMEDAEASDTAVQGTVDAVAARQETRDTARGPEEAHLADLRRDLVAAETDRDERIAAIDANDLALYTRVSGRLHPAVVRLEGDSCGGCHLPLGIQEARGVRSASGLVQCNNCDRILTT